MARVLKYPANCYKCGKRCDPVEEKARMKTEPGFQMSFLTKRHGYWKAHCYPCYKGTNIDSALEELGKQESEKAKN